MARAEREAFRALYETDDGGTGKLVQDWRFVATLAASAEVTPSGLEEARTPVLETTLGLIQRLEKSNLPVRLNAAASGAYWATSRFIQAESRLEASLEVLARLQQIDEGPSATQVVHAPPPEQVGDALESLAASLRELKVFAGMHGLIRHTSSDTRGSGGSGFEP